MQLLFMNNFYPQLRIGNGYDIHKFREKINNWGGIINTSKWFGLGSQDADVLCHSIMDALIGSRTWRYRKIFPPTEAKWKNADSLELLFNIVNLIRDKGWSLTISTADNLKTKIKTLY